MFFKNHAQNLNTPQNNSASWDLQMGFNSAFKGLKEFYSWFCLCIQYHLKGSNDRLLSHHINKQDFNCCCFIIIIIVFVVIAAAACATVIIIFIEANFKHFFCASKHCRSDNIMNQAQKIRSFLKSEQSMFCLPPYHVHIYATCPHYCKVLIIFLVVVETKGIKNYMLLWWRRGKVSSWVAWVSYFSCDMWVPLWETGVGSVLNVYEVVRITYFSCDMWVPLWENGVGSVLHVYEVVHIASWDTNQARNRGRDNTHDFIYM